MNPGLVLIATQLPLQLIDFSTIEFLPVSFIYALQESILSHSRIHNSEEYIYKCILNEFETNVVNYQ